MTFIKIQNVVINQSYIVVVRLDNQTVLGEKSVSVLIVSPQCSWLQWNTITQNLSRFDWIEFTSQAVNALQDYFTSFNNFIDLLPQYQASAV